jgi:parvulin-like peptidyl-prolyl isomerase
MNNKKSIITNISLALLTLCLITSCGTFTKKTSDDKQIVATYKNGSISSKQAQLELNKLIIKNPSLKNLTFNDLDANQKEMVVKEIVLKKIAAKKAKQLKLHKSKDYKQALKLFKTELLKQKLFLELANNAKTEENLKASYDELTKALEGKQDIRIRYITLNTKNDAKALRKILVKSPRSFASNARKKSTDKQTAKKGGDLGYVLEDSLPIEIVKQAKKLRRGRVSKPFKLAQKWVIIKLEGTRPAKIAKFEDAKQDLAQNLSTKALQEFISKSFEEANISISVK